MDEGRSGIIGRPTNFLTIGSRLTVGHRSLKPRIMVRIHAPEPLLMMDDLGLSIFQEHDPCSFLHLPCIDSRIVQQLGYLALNQEITVQLRVRVPFHLSWMMKQGSFLKHRHQRNRESSNSRTLAFEARNHWCESMLPSQFQIPGSFNS